MRELTDKPFGVNIAQLFVRDASIVDFVAENGVSFVTTSAGDPTKYTKALKDAGLTVFHVVPSLRGALKAVDAGVDGLVVEGNEGGGFKAPTGASTMVLLPLIASRVDVPIIAAGGVCDGRSMAAALVLGAEGVQMGTRMVSAAESPVHDNWKQLICTSNEGDTLLLNRHSPPAFRVLRTGFSEAAEREDRAVIPKLESVHDLYFGGNLEASFAFSGQVAGRITEVLPVAQILRETIAECELKPCISIKTYCVSPTDVLVRVDGAAFRTAPCSLHWKTSAFRAQQDDTEEDRQARRSRPTAPRRS